MASPTSDAVRGVRDLIVDRDRETVDVEELESDRPEELETNDGRPDVPVLDEVNEPHEPLEDTDDKRERNFDDESLPVPVVPTRNANAICDDAVPTFLDDVALDNDDEPDRDRTIQHELIFRDDGEVGVHGEHDQLSALQSLDCELEFF